MSKKCSHCQIKKEITAFCRNKNKHDGLDNNCKACNKLYKKDYYIKNRNKLLSAQKTDNAKQRRKELSKKPKRKYIDYKADAKRRGIIFTLEFDFFKKVLTENCYYCDIEHPNGIDRRDSNKGYTITNVVACCWICNRMKNVLSHTEFINTVTKISKNWSTK